MLIMFMQSINCVLHVLSAGGALQIMRLRIVPRRVFGPLWIFFVARFAFFAVFYYTRLVANIWVPTTGVTFVASISGMVGAFILLLYAVAGLLFLRQIQPRIHELLEGVP